MRAPARELFRDAAFPAADSSLLSGRSTPLARLRGDITWRRPQEICAAPRLFSDSPQEGPVKQGLLGDCWFLCACAALGRSRPLLHQVFPPGQPHWRDPEYRGAFTCRVWQFGRWVEVTVDDRLPCLAGRLCFSRCHSEDVFWLPLLEKVYAKVYGSYEHLWAGQVADALVDLTGGLAERWSLKDLAGASGEQDGRPAGGPELRTCRQLLRLQDQCLISCSVLSPRPGASGLGEFHAFIISEVREVPTGAGPAILLLRIQNPWGRRCWQGPWREGGEGWSRVDAAEASGLLSRLQEGEFWVEEEEFLREFDEVTIGYPVTEAGHLQSLRSGGEAPGQPAQGPVRTPRGGHPVPRLRPGGAPALRAARGPLPGCAQHLPEGRAGAVPAACLLHREGLPQCHPGRPQPPLPGGAACRRVGDRAAGGCLAGRPDGGRQQELCLLPHQPLLPALGARGRRPPQRAHHPAPALRRQPVPPHRLPRLPGAARGREPRGTPAAAPGAGAELRAPSLRPGGARYTARRRWGSPCRRPPTWR
ncbi:calpain-10 isoform X4 [Talpa occidentalis]|uniref:calpain-10 isoform X4 n=1 Tax=Talpa occidentalis TaxID=50954 RepID=UPI0023F6557D|nr:calpain-10 isoform X4 [Talpa occidentalis]